MNAPGTFVVAMPTLSRTPAEAQVLRAAISTLLESKLPLVVADAGSHHELGTFLDSAPGVSVISVQRLQGSALVRQIQAALAAAVRCDSRLVLYTEPDKNWFFEEKLHEFMAFAQAQRDAGIVFASRDEASLATFPAVQQLTERSTNALLGPLLGLDVDFLYGPMIIHKRLISCLRSLPDDLGWGWRIYLMAVARRLGWPVTPFQSYLPCPEEQRPENDECARLHRMEQMAQNLRGAVLGAKADVSAFAEPQHAPEPTACLVADG